MSDREWMERVDAACKAATLAERKRCATIARLVRNAAKAWPTGELGTDVAPETWVEATAERIATRIESDEVPT